MSIIKNIIEQRNIYTKFPAEMPVTNFVEKFAKIKIELKV